MTSSLPVGSSLYAPRGAAREALVCKVDEWMLDGPAGTGKSRVCLEKLNAMANKYAGCRLAIVRKVKGSLAETALVTFEQHVKPNCDTTNQQRHVRQSYKYPNGSEIVVAGMDNPVKLMSAEFDAIYVQEATELTLNDWEFLSTRLRNGVIPYQQLFGDCNPGPPTHWLKRRMDAGLTQRIVSRHEDNPRLFKNDGTLTEYGSSYIARLDKLTGARKQRLRYGLWVAAEGMVFENFDPALHIIEPFEIPSDWRRFRVIDFGFTHPFVCQWWAEDPDGRIYRYRELFKTKRTVSEHAAQIREYSRGEYIVATITDHDAEDRATLERELGIKTEPALKSVTTGVQAVLNRLALAGDGRPRMYFFSNALIERDPLLIDEETDLAVAPTCTEEEIESYIWAKGTGGETLKEVPVKLNDDGCDATRYMALWLEQPDLRPDSRQVKAALRAVLRR